MRGYGAAEGVTGAREGEESHLKTMNGCHCKLGSNQ